MIHINIREYFYNTKLIEQSDFYILKYYYHNETKQIHEQ